MGGKSEKNYTPMIVLVTVIFYISNRISYMYQLTPDTNIILRVNLILNNLANYFFGFPSFNTIDLVVGLGAVLIILMIVEMRSNGKKNYRKGVEHGSATWGTKKDIEPFLSKDKRNRVLLSNSESIMINEKPDHPKNQRNQNVLVVGGSGSGKTRYAVKPNLLQFNSSYVITDPKGETLKSTGSMFLEKGYKVKIFNTIDLLKSMGFNPYVYIKSESDILKFVDFLMANTSNDKKQGGDQFWTDAEKLLHLALIGYMYDVCSEDEFNFETHIRLINHSYVSEEDDGFENPIDLLMKEHEEEFPEAFCVSQYKKFKLAAGKTAKTILISAGVRLAPLDIKEVREATRIDELELDKIGDEKTVLFLLVSDTSSTFDFIVGILYSLLLNKLIEHADNQPDNGLNYHVQLLLDEFANTGVIPNFEKIIATIRSRRISAMIFLQSKAQLKAKYKDSADTIIGNCDSEVFLGGREGTTLKDLSESLGKETVDILNRNLSYGQNKSWSDNNSMTGRELLTASELSILDNENCIVQIRGVKPFMSKKIELEKHPNYDLLSEDISDGKQFNPVSYINEYRIKMKYQGKAEKITTKSNNKLGSEEVYTVEQNPLEYSNTQFDPTLLNENTNILIA